MIYLKEYNEYKDIDAICKRYGIENYTINDDGSIDVDGSVYLNEMDLKKLPLKFNRVSGSFHCDNNKLITLEGAPKWVGRTFYCFDNQLTSLEGAPEEVGGYFNCQHNQLTSLVGAPKWVGGDFNCCVNELTSLVGPKSVGGDFNCSFNQLTSLKGAPKLGGDFYCYSNPNLPDLINKNLDDVEYILKWQDEYSIWKPDGSLDEYKFKEMMQDK